MKNSSSGVIHGSNKWHNFGAPQIMSSLPIFCQLATGDIFVSSLFQRIEKTRSYALLCFYNKHGTIYTYLCACIIIMHILVNFLYKYLV